MKKKPMKKKVVVNYCYGGFGLSQKAEELYRQYSGDTETYAHDIPRHCPHLVRVVEELGKAASGPCANLVVEEIEGNRYLIFEYDGAETLNTPENMDWTVIEG